MAVLAYTYLEMTDGTDTVTFSTGVAPGALPGWPLADTGWGPAIAGLRTSPLGGRGPYADVEELITCNILSTTAALCYANLDTLARLLDKAERWWLRNEAISPVLLKYAPQGSTIHSVATPMKAIVLGRVGTAELNGVALPKDYDDAGMLFEINGVEIACLRRGAWTGATDATSTSGSAANPTVMTRAFSATHPTSSPMSVSIGGFQQTTTPTIQAGYLIVGSAVSDIQIVEAEDAAGGAFYASVADAAGNARGGNVLRYTPTGATPVTTGSGTSITLPSAVNGLVAVIAAVRNNSATTTWLLQAILNGLSTEYVQTPPYLIDTSTLLPRLVLLGTVNGGALENLRITVQASAASGTLDIDYLILVNLRDETVAIIAHDAIPMTNMGAGAATLDVLFNPTTQQDPTMQATRGSGLVTAVWRGPLPLQTKGINVYALWTATNGASWRFTTTAPAVMNATLQATRYTSFLSPQ